MIQEVCHLAGEKCDGTNICHVKFTLTPYTIPAVIALVRPSVEAEKPNAAGPKVASKGPKRRSNLERVEARHETDAEVIRCSLRKQPRLSKLSMADLPPKKGDHLQFKEDEIHAERLSALMKKLPGSKSRGQVARKLFRIGLHVMEMVEGVKEVRA